MPTLYRAKSISYSRTVHPSVPFAWGHILSEAMGSSGEVEIMKLIPVGSQHQAMVDDWAFEWLNRFEWRLKIRDGKPYAFRILREEPECSFISMHRTILLVEDPAADLLSDHRDGNTLNNQVENLRWSTPRQNSANRKPVRNGLKGFSWSNHKKCWRAVIGYNGEKIRLGTSREEDRVARMYDHAARLLFGEFANLNFPNDHRDVLSERMVKKVLSRKTPEVRSNAIHRFVEVK